MTATASTKYTLWCDAPGCQERFIGQFKEGRTHLRQRAARIKGWANAVSRDFCRDHADPDEDTP